MNYYSRVLASILVGVTLLYGSQVSADDQPTNRYSESDNVPLGKEDLRDITAQVMVKYPLLASSPGIKYADADRIGESEIWATVIFYPHSESAGIKEAFQVDCTKNVDTSPWNCEEPSIRRYLALDTQDFEVRVTGPIDSYAAVALIEATKKVLPVRVNDVSDVPDTAMTLRSYDDRATVTWVNFKGRSHQIVKGQLIEGGDPTRPQDWIVNRN